jgi:hypothetical protein
VVDDEAGLDEPETVDVGVSLAAAPEASAPFEFEPPTDLWPDSPQDRDLGAEPEGDAEGPDAKAEPEANSEGPDAEAEPEPEPDSEGTDAEAEPESTEPTHVGVDPEPHFELQAEVPESIGAWHLLVGEPEPPPGLCVAFAPTRAGYRLVPLSQVPSVGEKIDVDGLGPLLVLRVGASPLPGDTRVCAYVEDAVVPAPAIT